MDAEREDGGPTSKTTLSGEHGRRSKAKSPEQQQRAYSPGTRRVSMKSIRNLFRKKKQINEQGIQQERADSPGPSCVSMKSDRSMDQPYSFKDGNQQPSKERQHQEWSEVTSAQSVQQHQTELIKRAEENAHAFLDKELKKLWRDLFSDYPQCPDLVLDRVLVPALFTVRVWVLVPVQIRLVLVPALVLVPVLAPVRVLVLVSVLVLFLVPVPVPVPVLAPVRVLVLVLVLVLFLVPVLAPVRVLVLVLFLVLVPDLVPVQVLVLVPDYNET
ncbi:uncharacterized protein LOC130381058 [Gadus chalcogrammus]|uniref:uncharacterized protein LOC130381058 n=1 Tax=Gadus chalcogrammus TaxID=1042646 RepID=UPI0024C2CEF2|nr:uncharacterized protein LOC130381058 [Gadus chalcogrammus]